MSPAFFDVIQKPKPVPLHILSMHSIAESVKNTLYLKAIKTMGMINNFGIDTIRSWIAWIPTYSMYAKIPHTQMGVPTMIDPINST
jgi:hypothetical protein